MIKPSREADFQPQQVHHRTISELSRDITGTMRPVEQNADTVMVTRRGLSSVWAIMPVDHDEVVQRVRESMGLTHISREVTGREFADDNEAIVKGVAYDNETVVVTGQVNGHELPAFLVEPVEDRHARAFLQNYQRVPGTNILQRRRPQSA